MYAGITFSAKLLSIPRTVAALFNFFVAFTLRVENFKPKMELLCRSPFAIAWGNLQKDPTS